MSHSPNPETTQHRVRAEIATHETSLGTHIECQTAVDGDASGMSAFLTKQFERDIVAAPSTWIFKGPRHEEAASFVVRVAELARQAQPKRFAGYAAITLPGNTGEEPMVGVVIASTAAHGPTEVTETARALAMETNQLLEDGQSAIRLPLTD